jgi:hypothetical protein
MSMETSTILAACGGDLWPFIIGGIFLLVKGLASKGDAAAPPPPSPTRRPAATTEEERARRFREALGLPADGSPAPPQGRVPSPGTSGRHQPTSMRQPAPPPPPLTRRPTNLPVPPIVANPPRKRSPQPMTPPPLHREEVSLDSLPAPTGRAEDIQAGTLKVPEYHEFHTTSSEVQAIPYEKRIALEQAKAERRGNTVDELRALLRHRSTLRSAILLREILGPAPGLQTPGRGPTFPSP